MRAPSSSSNYLPKAHLLVPMTLEFRVSIHELVRGKVHSIHNMNLTTNSLFIFGVISISLTIAFEFQDAAWNFHTYPCMKGQIKTYELSMTDSGPHI